MSFNSITYAIFLPIVFLLYWAIPNRYRWILLLAASYYFYMSWNPKYIVLILFTTLVSYVCALLMEKTDSKTTRKTILTIALIVCLGVLFVFKYYDFTVKSISMISPVSPRLLNLLLPVGISFYTFQTLSYVIDVYRGDLPAEKHFGIYATYVSFFPQLVAGPIERSTNFLPQIKQEHVFDSANAHAGIRLIVWGLYKKIVIADNLALYVDIVYRDIRSFSGFSLVLAALFFILQVYCDFSAYTDIARGSAKLFGIELMENFKSPFWSTSVKELWGRWHISMSSWFRDYLYIPLGGSRVSNLRHCFNMVLTFIISGLWHGANWTFVIWGGLQGVAQIIETAYDVRPRKTRDIYFYMRCLIVFAFFTWSSVFFRAGSVSDGFYAATHFLSGLSHPRSFWLNGVEALHLDFRFLRIFLLGVVPLTLYDFCSLKTDVFAWIAKRHVVIRHLLMISAIAIILTYGFFGKSTFVYFQF